MREQLRAAVGSYIEQAISDQVFPGCVLAVWTPEIGPTYLCWGKTSYDSQARETGPETLYDLASLTKALVTAPLLLHLFEEGTLWPGMTLKECIQGTACSELAACLAVPGDKQEITLYQLLHHTAGFPPWLPLYEKISSGEEGMPGSRETGRQRPGGVGGGHESGQNRISRMVEYIKVIFNTPLMNPPGEKTEYSDLGFILLGFMVECCLGKPLNELFIHEVLEPLAIEGGLHLTFNPSSRQSIAPSSYCLRTNTPLAGQVHDMNARVMGGVAGHAGLFGSASGLMKLLAGLMGGNRVLSLYHPKTFLASGWPLRFCYGFDTPARHGSQAGTLFSPQTIGHLGYTGTSFWMDLAREIIVIFLTNRTYPNDSSHSRTEIQRLRPVVHDEVLSMILAYTS